MQMYILQQIFELNFYLYNIQNITYLNKGQIGQTIHISRSNECQLFIAFYQIIP